MHILITGAAGFLGQLVAQRLLNDEENTVLMTDISDPPVPQHVKYPQNARSVKANLCSDSAAVVEPGLDAVYIFHGIMSAQSEQNFDLAFSVNVTATCNLLDALQKTCPGTRVIYASSLAVYGRPLPNTADESVRPTPESSYGATKLISETIINDYTRRGVFDGYILRFPSVVIRPGRPSAAASAFMSGMIREPMQGQESVIPLEDRSFECWICSPRTLGNNLIHALKVPSSSLSTHDRAVNMPGTGASIQQMLDALGKIGGEDRLRLVREETDPVKEEILRSWASKFDDSKAYKLGYQPDAGFEQAVKDYQESLA